MKYYKSPLNYIGGKYRLLNQILPIFPESIDTFVDLFAGGLDVSLNTQANHYICNDINFHIIDMYKSFQKASMNDILTYIDKRIAEFNLSKENAKGYQQLRYEYNLKHNPFDLFLLICYGFNHQIRFNNSQEFNNPFGRNRSCFNLRIKENLIKFKCKTDNFIFKSYNFKQFDFSQINRDDLVYCDPPYLITTGPYNDGKRGFEGWTSNEDIYLFKILDDLNARSVKFVLSNVSVHKGKTNTDLLKWAQRYRIIELTCSYNNCNYHSYKSNETK